MITDKLLNFINLPNNDRVPVRYVQASKWYDDNDRQRTAETSNFLTNLRDNIYKKGKIEGVNTRDIRGSRLNGLKFATEDDEKSMAKTLQAETDNLLGNLSTQNYVPFFYTEGWNSPIRTAYLVRHFRTGGDDTIFGMETEDGRSFTASGAKKFLDKLEKTDGAGAVFANDPQFAGKYGQFTQNLAEVGEGLPARKRGFLEALHSISNGATERQNENGEIGAFPSNWWGR